MQSPRVYLNNIGSICTDSLRHGNGLSALLLLTRAAKSSAAKSSASKTRSMESRLNINLWPCLGSQCRPSKLAHARRLFNWRRSAGAATSTTVRKIHDVSVDFPFRPQAITCDNGAASDFTYLTLTSIVSAACGGGGGGRSLEGG